MKDFFLRESERVVRFEGIVFSENESEYSEIIFPPFLSFLRFRERERIRQCEWNELLESGEIVRVSGEIVESEM